MNKEFNRRNFLKTATLAAASGLTLGVPGGSTNSLLANSLSEIPASQQKKGFCITITYLGESGLFGTAADNVVVGSTTADLTYTNVDEYALAFSDPMVFDWDGLNNRFRFSISGDDGNLRLKTRPANESPSGQGGPVLSVAGSFTPIPEPSSFVLFSILELVTLSGRRQRR